MANGLRSPLFSFDDDAESLHPLAAAGTLAMSTYLSGAAVRWAYRRRLPTPLTLPYAIDADARTFELREGRTNYYLRSGAGPPIVLLHSFNAAASSFEMKPIFDHLAAVTDRPLYAVDWLGFGRSARPDAAYAPVLYLNQLRRFLRERVQAPADVVALSLGAEYAARIAQATPTLVRRLALISPTGFGTGRGPSLTGRLFVDAAHCIGAFELLFYGLTQPASIRHFYTRQVFFNPHRTPDALVNYAYLTAHVRGGHYAPRRFVDGTLFPPSSAASIYARLYRPTLLVTPRDASDMVQGFEHAAEVVAQNARDLTRCRLASGLLPQWEDPDTLFDALDDFLLSDAPPDAD